MPLNRLVTPAKMPPIASAIWMPPTLPRCGMEDGCALIQIQSSFSCAIDARKKNTGKAITAQIVDAAWTEVNRMPKPTVPVIVTDPDGKEHRFPSVTAAAKYIGVIPPRVSTACTLGIRLHGYRVRYENGVGQ